MLFGLRGVSAGHGQRRGPDSAERPGDLEVQIHRPGVSNDATVAARQRRGLLLPVAALGVALLLPLAMLLGTVRGWKFQPIETGSMAPRYPAGSLAIVEPIDPADVRAGMTIVFDDPLLRGRLVAHRVVKRLPGSSPVWMTKGDANAESDPAPVHAAAVQGRVRWAMPAVGRVAAEVNRGRAVVLLVGVPLAILLLTEIAAVRRRRHAAASAAQGVSAR